MPFDLNLKALVLTTTPPFPRDYGNRNRVFQLIERLKSLGYRISLVLYPFDEDWERGVPPYYKDLVDEYEYFCVVPATRKLHQPALNHHHTVDEWWDANIGTTLEWLFKRKPFDLFVVNYTFLSQALDYAPPGTAKLLETHDLFSGRREAFEAHGVAPEFFYTTAAEERIAFNRAEVIIAIKDAEAATISAMTSASVISIPYWDTSRPTPNARAKPKPLTFDHERPLRVGFIGAQNSVNIVNMQRFLVRFRRWMRLYNPPLRVVVAGNVCRGLAEVYPFLDKLGRVEKIEDFYDQVDIIIAPLEFSTGIKIKVGEALAWDKPVVATHNAFDGYRSWRRSQSLASVDDVCDELVGLAMNESPWVDLVLDARRAARSARTAQENGFVHLQRWLRARSKQIVVVTDRPLWRRDTLIDEHLAHTIEFLSHLGKVLVVNTARDAPDATRIFAPVNFVRAAPEEVEQAIRAMQATSTLLCLILGPGAPEGAARAAPAETLVWRLELGQRAGAAYSSPARLVGLANAPTIPLSVLRYAPVGGVNPLDDAAVLILAPEHADEWEQAVLDYVIDCARGNGLRETVVRAPAAFETSAAAFSAVTTSGARRIVLVGGEGWLDYVVQIARYREQRCMIASRLLIAPNVVNAEGGVSLADAVDGFLNGAIMATTSSDWDSGWDRVWSVLDERSSTTLQVHNGGI